MDNINKYYNVDIGMLDKCEPIEIPRYIQW